MSHQGLEHEKHLHETVRTQSFGTLWRMMRLPFLLLSTFIVPPLMGKETYGQYALFISVMIIWDTVSRLGTAQIFGRFVPEFKPEQREGISHVLHGVMFVGVLMTLIAVAAGYAWLKLFGLKGFNPAWFPALFAVLVLTKIEGTLYGFAFGMNQIGFFSAKETMRSAFTFIFVVALYWLYGLAGALWGLAANEAALGLVAAWWTRDYLFRKPRLPRFAELKPYIMFGITFSLPSFFFGLQQRSGHLFISQLTGFPEQVSYFDIANQFLLITGMNLRFFLSTLIPALTVLHVKGDEAAVRRWHRGAMVLCGLFVFFAYHALALMGRNVLKLWLHWGTEDLVFRNAMAMGLSLVPLMISQVGLNLAVLDKKPGAYAGSVLIGFAAMAVACVALVPRWESMGASWATLIGYSASALAFLPRYRGRLTGTLGGFGKLLLLGCLFAPLYFCRFELVTSCVIFAASSALYVGAVLLLGIIKISELKTLLDAFRKGRKGT